MRVFVAGATGAIGHYLVSGWRDGFPVGVKAWADGSKAGTAVHDQAA